jgi:hypothetical protein
MPKFISDRDVTFFKSIAREVVDDVVQDSVVLYKVNLFDTKTNIYGEAINKSWHIGVQLNCLIDKQPQSQNYEGFGPNTSQTISFKFDRFMLEEKNTYPEIGDVIFFDTSYYELNNIVETQYTGGLPQYNFSIVCSGIMVAKSGLNIEERIL